MSSRPAITRAFYLITAFACAFVALDAQTAPPTQGGQGAAAQGAQTGGQGRGGPGRGGQAPATVPEFPATMRGNILRGQYGPHRANNDLLFYHLDIRIDPDAKKISGKNTVRFKMLKDDTRIQLDLYANLAVDKILLTGTTGPELTYYRDMNTVLVDFPQTLKAGQTYAIDFYYSATHSDTSRLRGLTFAQDPAGRPWIYTTCEGPGAATWWPNKDQWRDEVESMRISVAVPNALTDVSNGKFLGKTDLGDGYTRWDWHVQYPINNYNVSVNIGHYVTWTEPLGDMPMDFFTLPEDQGKAKPQFAQAKAMLEGFAKFFGEFPFKKDGYKLIQVPYSGMEHQTAVTYGNGFRNGYGGRDWTGVGISPRFDFIVIHESAHEYFGNAVSAADVSDMWIQEGWCTYLEGLYVEHMWGKEDGIKYLNGYKRMVQHRSTVIQPRGLHRSPMGNDQYFKGALFINTLRSVVNDDAKWFKLIRDMYDKFKYQNIMTEDMVAFFNQQTGRNFTPLFDQYLRHTQIPTLELKFDEAAKTVSYRWKADEAGFSMPVRVGKADAWQIVQPTTEWKSMPTTLTKDEFGVATDLYFVNVTKQ
jgi:aminopeptidase N